MKFDAGEDYAEPTDSVEKRISFSTAMSGSGDTFQQRRILFIQACSGCCMSKFLLVIVSLQIAKATN